MRLLHTSDWHLGATLGRLSREDEQADVLAEMINIAADFEPHLILHTGDLFDGVRPSVETMRLGMDALRRLAEHAPVVVVSGNHDSRPLFRLLNQILSIAGANSRIRFVADVVRPEQGGVMEFAGDEGEAIRLACLPFLHANTLVDVFETRPEGWTGVYADGVRLLQEMFRRGFEDGFDSQRHVNVYAAHLHVGGAVLARSERVVHVSDDYAVDAESLPPVSYAALGHIHKPQKLPGLVMGRYAGSPIQLDYGEMGEQKSVVTVEARPGQGADVRTVQLSAGRPLVRLEGTLDELKATASQHQGRAILTATVVTDEPTSGLADQLAALFPEADLHLVHNRVVNQEYQAVTPMDEVGAASNFRDLFREYLPARDELGTRLSRRLIALFDELLEAVETEQDPTLQREAAVSSEGG